MKRYNDDFLFKATLLEKFWNDRDRELSPAYSSEIGYQKQKFLVLYNLLANTRGSRFTFEKLKAFESGPVYYDVYSEVKFNKTLIEQIPTDPEFVEECKKIREDIDESILKIATFLSITKSWTELIEFIHLFDLWKKNYNKTMTEESNQEYTDDNNISVDDISEKDKKRLCNILTLLNDEYLDNIEVKKYKYNYIAIKKYQIKDISKYENELNEINLDFNPVDVTIEDGVIVID